MGRDRSPCADCDQAEWHKLLKILPIMTLAKWGEGGNMHDAAKKCPYGQWSFGGGKIAKYKKIASESIAQQNK